MRRCLSRFSNQHQGLAALVGEGAGVVELLSGQIAADRKLLDQIQ